MDLQMIRGLTHDAYKAFLLPNPLSSFGGKEEEKEAKGAKATLITLIVLASLLLLCTH